MPIVISQLIPDTAQAHLTSSFFFSFLYYAVTQTYFIPSTTQLDMQNSNITLIFFFFFFFKRIITTLSITTLYAKISHPDWVYQDSCRTNACL